MNLRSSLRAARLTLFCLTLGLLFSASIDAQTAPAMRTPDLVMKVDAYIDAQAKINNFSGAVLVARDGEILVNRAYGFANRATRAPNTADTRFRVGSVTKQFTAAAILLLQERGKLNTNDPICKHILNCPPAWNGITIHHLLTHTSGIPEYFTLPGAVAARHEPTTLAASVKRFRDAPLDFAPGEKHSYSNSGYLLLGDIIERVSGKPHEAFMRENIFAPLGMTNTGVDRIAAPTANSARGYTLEGERFVDATDRTNMSLPHAAGALHSTVGDLHKWDEALFGGKLLSKASLAQMFTPFKDGYAYGWGIGTRGRRLIQHEGAIDGFRANNFRFPEERVNVVVLSNFDAAPVTPMGLALGAILFGEPYQTPQPKTENKIDANVDPKIYDAYVGEYRLAPTFSIIVTREGDKLMAQATGQSKFEIYPKSPTEFFYKVVDAQIDFVKGADGKVTHLVLHQNGIDQRGDKQPERAKFTVDPKTFDALTGQYQLAPDFIITVTKEADKLIAQATGQGKFELIAESDVVYVIPSVGAKITFTRDAGGKVTSLTLDQAGVTQTARKIK